MNIYFYCSYEHSQKGFFMTQLKDGELLPAVNIPTQVSEFFSYDRFQLLWVDNCDTNAQKKGSPAISGGFFGLRNVTGRNRDGRSFVVNMAIKAEPDERQLLSNTVKTVLGDFGSFKNALISHFSVGGPCSYTVDFNAFDAWLKKASSCGKISRLEGFDNKLKPMLKFIDQTEAPKKEVMLLRLAVYTTDREDVVKVMGGKKVWKKRHPCAIDPDTFSQLFEGPYPVWETLQ